MNLFMATFIFPLFIFSLLYITSSAAAVGPASTTTTNNFIQSKCSSTTYPTVCVQSLSSFANKIQTSQRQLTQTALIVSLAKARYTKAYVAHLAHSNGLKPSEFGPIKDCFEVIGDTVDRLSMSIHEFQSAARAHSSDFLWHMSNVQTWVSAALTDENTCVDGFSGRAVSSRMKNGIKTQFQGVLQCTSNALTLVNQFADKYSPNDV
ncbi:pectinesterase inhibitor 11-like [Amaranthus tricolor]|uniref:pectinesterase inhibitor 11-like n=1 Tax=Amaranthus tricolor TaxID=29722 RepID=UPI002587CB7E|nr:pectinesterase inhibitor 11-like [Amaranthus tricolor]